MNDDPHQDTQDRPTRWTEVLCQLCGGNGVLKIPGGIATCQRCNGHCYEPANYHCPLSPAPLSAPAEPLWELAREAAQTRHDRRGHGDGQHFGMFKSCENEACRLVHQPIAAELSRLRALLAHVTQERDEARALKAQS